MFKKLKKRYNSYKEISLLHSKQMTEYLCAKISSTHLKSFHSEVGENLSVRNKDLVYYFLKSAGFKRTSSGETLLRPE